MGKLGLPLGHVLLGLAIAAILIIVQTVTPSGVTLGFKPLGGTELILQVQSTAANPTITDQDMAIVQQVIENRLAELGRSQEWSVQPSEPHQFIVWLGEGLDREQAARVLGDTAQLEFRAQEPGTEEQFQVESRRLQQYQWELDALESSNSANSESMLPGETAESEALQQQMLETNATIASLFFAPASITGTSLVNADASLQQSTHGRFWEIVIEFNAEGADNFAELTRKVAGTGRRIGIFLDGRLISAPTVDVLYAETGITGGSAVIAGQFTAASANELAIQLRSGALPLPVEVLEVRRIAPDASQNNPNQSRNIERMMTSVAVLTATTNYYRVSLRS